MIRLIFAYFIGLFLIAPCAQAQGPCTALGQNPSTAFPVCGTSTFTQASVPICGSRNIPSRCTSIPLSDKNPFWYKFTCFGSGTLAFVITPNTISDDYDWQLFDITNRDPDDVFTDVSLFVACNWSGDGGLTGASSAGTSLVRCDGPGVPLFSSMPNLIQGHQYILLVSHFSDSQSGYSLSFGGGTANITDPKDPDLQGARAACDGSRISIKLNKQMKCTSLSSNGSEFTLTPAVANIINATGINCSNGFDMDSIVLTLSGIVPPGNYTVSIKNGVDGNTLFDNCDRTIPVGNALPVTVFPLVPTPMDSLTKPGCAPNEIQLVFRDPMQCNSIAPDGSDFTITGTNPISISSASGLCNTNGLATVISVKFASPIQVAGNYTIRLKTGTDGNSIINECNVETPVGAALNFTTKDTVSARFNYQIKYGCLADTVLYRHNGANTVNQWQWTFDAPASTSTLQNPQVIYNIFGKKNIQLTVSNGTCTASYSDTVFLDNAIEAKFENTAVVCPGDPATFKDLSTGNISSWNWDFGNNNFSNAPIPPDQFYPIAPTIRDIPVQLIIQNGLGCSDTARSSIRVAGNCYIAIPKAFSPNGDGLNDFLYPTNAYKAKDLLFRVFNRSGQLLFETRDWMKRWNGTFKGNPQDPGTYVWILQYTHIDTGKRIEQKGSTVLLR
ncbi:MAG: gliding motility-associated C-terminal domain-containing protein [Ferruginibacter sp.]